MSVSSQLHVPAAYSPGKRMCYPLVRRLGVAQNVLSSRQESNYSFQLAEKPTSEPLMVLLFGPTT
jgi:hypothetical protein